MNRILVLLLVPCLYLAGCKSGQLPISDVTLTTIIATGTNLAFKYALTDPSKRTVIAKYVSGIAGAARALTGKEDANQVAQALVANIPPDIMAKYPEIGTIVIPTVVNYYQSAKEHFGANTQEFSARMNAIASGLEKGVASYL